MSRQSKRNQYERTKYRIEASYRRRAITESDRDAILEFLSAKDPQDNSVRDTEDEGKSNSTLREYASKLRLLAVRSTIPLTEMDVDDVNSLMTDHLEGSVRVLDEDHLGDDPDAAKNADAVKPDGLSEGGVRALQTTIRKFYGYHEVFEVDKEEIRMESMPEPAIDERDMFSRDEIEALRTACKNPRDRCLIELLLNTGQRIRALLSLRVKDIDVEKGVYYLNEEAEGLKGAADYGPKRPLLGARSAVCDWLHDGHPCPDDSEAHLLTNLPGYTTAGHEPGDPLAPQYVNKRLQQLGNEAEVEKPTNPHAWRHNFVTIAHREYQMDKDTIRHLIGHGPNSKVMETTYKHLDDDDYVQSAEEALGIRVPESGANLTPTVCHVCEEPLEPHWKSCPACGEVYAPDAEAAGDFAGEHLWESNGGVRGEDEEHIEAVKQAIVENPELVGEVVRQNPELFDMFNHEM